MTPEDKQMMKIALPIVIVALILVFLLMPSISGMLGGKWFQ